MFEKLIGAIRALGLVLPAIASLDEPAGGLFTMGEQKTVLIWLLQHPWDGSMVNLRLMDYLAAPVTRQLSAMILGAKTCLLIQSFTTVNHCKVFTDSVFVYFGSRRTYKRPLLTSIGRKSALRSLRGLLGSLITYHPSSFIKAILCLQHIRGLQKVCI